MVTRGVGHVPAFGGELRSTLQRAQVALSKGVTDVPAQPGDELPEGGSGLVTHGGSLSASSAILPLAFAPSKSDSSRTPKRCVP